MNCSRMKPKCDGKIAGLYDLEDTVGRGHYAVVKVARHVFTGEKVAVKVMAICVSMKLGSTICLAVETELNF